MSLRSILPRPFTAAVLLFAVVAGTACSATSDDDPTASPATPVTEASDDPGSPPDVATEQLGFDGVDLTAPDPEPEAALDPEAETLVFATSGDLIDAGVASGAFSEIEGVRAVVSVVMGELSVEAVPGLAAVVSTDHPGILDRAERLLADESIDQAQRADLARLTAFFFADEPTGGATADDPGNDDEEGAYGEVVLASYAAPTGTLCQIDEALIFGATDTLLCYREFINDDGDSVLVADTFDASDQSDRIFELIDQARTGYEAMGAGVLPTVRVLLSTELSPPDGEDEAGSSSAHVMGRGTNPCRVAAFADTSINSSIEFDYVMAHELFHCVQNTWGGTLSQSPIVLEGGAAYFSQKLLNTCGTRLLTAYGPRLDGFTINNSVLDADYAGWYFWKYLDQHGHLSTTGIVGVHQQVAAGGPLDGALLAALPDPAKVLNEFYVRMVGPGLACDFRGAAFLGGPPDISSPGPVELQADFWVGTRYSLEYTQQRHFEQQSDGAGPIGMANLLDAAAEGAWVVVEPDIRTKCSEPELWSVVVTAAEPGSSAVHTLDVTKAAQADCDPCLLGAWSIELGTMAEYFEGFAPQASGVELTLGGSWTLEFSADPPTMTDNRNMTIDVSIEDVGSGPTTQITGSGSGSFSSNGERFTVSGFSDSTQATVQGLSSPWSTSSGGGSSPYTCDDTTMTFQMPNDDVTVVATRREPLPEGVPYFG